MKTKNKILILYIFILTSQITFAMATTSSNRIYAPWVSSEKTPKAPSKKGRVERGYIVPKSYPHPKGAQLDVEIYQDRKNAAVTLELQASINNGNGRSILVSLGLLSQNVIDNPNSYYSVRSFVLDYEKLNKSLTANGINSNLMIGPGTPLFVYAKFSTGHQWGGPARGGIFYMPITDPQVQQKDPVGAPRSTELDLAFPINTTLANIFNASPANGLKIGGQIRSRVEGEGKYQILTESDFNQTVQNLFKLANDAKLTAQVLGPDWSLKIEDRYMLKNSSGKLLLDTNRLPRPDPMIDTYYDNDFYDAAKNDMAIRYRYTANNKTGSWNFKPGMGVADSENIVYRNEYAVDTTDDSPNSIRNYADSSHPLNIFLPIRSLNTSALPSSFFNPSVKITDTRYKFKLEHKSGLIVEVSMDHAMAEDLRGHAKAIRMFQMEMDIDHLATKSNKVAGVSNISGLKSESSSSLSRFGKKAFFNGATRMHDADDIKEKSLLRNARKAEFDLASATIVKLRDYALGGAKWFPGSQKYAVSAHALGLVSKYDTSPSVKRLLTEIEKLTKGPLSCKNLF